VADAYMFTVLRWSGRVKVDIAPYKNIATFMERVQARPKVQEAMKVEGLIQ
jgi:glutathione S-transferase